MLKLNYKCLLLFLINFNFSISHENELKNVRENLIAQWQSEFTADTTTTVQRSKRESNIINSVNDFNSRSLVVIASEIDDNERVTKPVECLIKCVANANELFLVFDNTLLEDEINDNDQIKMYNRIKRSNGARQLDMRKQMDQMEAANLIRKYNQQNLLKPPLQKVEKIANNSFIILLDEDSVYTPQVFIHHRPLKIDIDEGESFQIKCSVSSIEDVTLEWLSSKNETLSKMSDTRFGTIDHYFDGIDVLESGNYTCTGENMFGITKQVLQINVKPSKLTAQIMPTKNYLAETNKPYALHCTVPPDFLRTTSITWYFNNQSAIYNDDLGVKNMALLIKNLNRNSNGRYSCTARMNKIIKTDYIDLKVEYPPELIGNPRITQNLYIRYDTNYTLGCEVANAVPDAVVIWDIMLRHNKQNIKKTLPYLLNPDIVFNGFKPTDEGTYTCYGENPLGKTPIRTFHIFGQASAKPTIKNSEAFPDKSKKIVLMKGDSVKFLTCKCENCMPLKKIEWLYNGNKIAKVDWKTSIYTESYVGNDKIGMLPLINTNISKSEEGEYMCYIENEFGSDVFTFDVQVVDFDTENLDEKDRATQIKCELEDNNIYSLLMFKENNETFLGYNTSRKSFKNDSVSAYGQLYKCTTYKLVYSKNPGFKMDNSPLGSFKLYTIIPNITNKALLSKVTPYNRPDYKICKFNDTEFLNEPNLVRSCENSRLPSEPFIVMSTQESEYPQLNQDVELYKDIYITSKTNEFLYLCDLFPYSEEMSKKKSYSCSITNELGFGQNKFLLYRREKPSVNKTVKDHIKILPGTKELISCDGYGNPEPEVYWTSPTGEKFIQIKKFPNKLEFSIIDEEIAGNYTCNAENIYGLSTKPTYVEIINIPKVNQSRNYREITVDPCQLKELPCPIMNAKSFKWTRTLENSDSEIFPMNFNGNYTCIGENEAGISEFTYIVKDSEAPLSIKIYLTNPENKILDDLSTTDPITTQIGEKLTAECFIHGASPSENIIWLKDNQEYSSEETIEILSLQPEDIGRYTCTGGNDKGTLSKSFEVILRGPPIFKFDFGQDKQKLSPTYQSSLALDCEAFASPDPVFLWFFNGILLRNERQGTFQLDNVSAQQNGEYHCLVKNEFGSINRKFSIETFNPLPEPSVPTEIEITEPEPLRVPCSVPNSPSLSQFYWIFEGHIALARDDPALLTALGPNEKIYFSDNNELYSSEEEVAVRSNRYGILSKSNDARNILFELVIQNSKFERDSGVYTCYVTNSVDTIERSVSVNVLAKPQSEDTETSDITVPEYTQTSLECSIKGNPDTQYTWDLNGQYIDQYTDPTISLHYYGRVLLFSNITQNHSGKIKCTGVNPLGTLTHVFNLRVDGPPKIIHPDNNTIDEREIENIIVTDDTPIKLSCPYISNQTPNINWHLVVNDNHDLLNEVTDTITIKPVPESATIYCTLENSFGFRKKMFNLIRLSSLRFTADEIEQPVKIMLGNYLLLNCSMEGTPNPVIQWMKDGEAILDYDRFIYYVQNSVVDDSGKYTCIGSNDVQTISRDFDVEIVSAVWDEWSEWSPCNVPCGVGTQFRTRKCRLNGQDARGMCDGDEVEVYECIQKACPEGETTPRIRIPITTPSPTTPSPPAIRPIFTPEKSNWGPWSECDLNCHDTINKRSSMRKRFCLDGNLQLCQGKSQEVQRCNVPNCPIHGGWGAWIESPCSVTCGEGVAKRRRYCTSPAPKHNGRNCHGNRMEAVPCKKLCK